MFSIVERANLRPCIEDRAATAHSLDPMITIPPRNICEIKYSEGYASACAFGGSPTKAQAETQLPAASGPGDDGAHCMDVASMLRHINSKNLHASRHLDCHAKHPEGRSPSNASGPRQVGLGCENIEQAIMLAETTKNGGARLRITLLAAGFVIGPGGESIRAIGTVTGADIRSKTVLPDDQCPRACREFTIEGSDAAMARALAIIYEAVQRYKTLCEGKCAGKVASRTQRIRNVEFTYQPPPRSAAPFAAQIKSSGGRQRNTKLNRPRSPRERSARQLSVPTVELQRSGISPVTVVRNHAAGFAGMERKEGALNNQVQAGLLPTSGAGMDGNFVANAIDDALRLLQTDTIGMGNDLVVDSIAQEHDALSHLGSSAADLNNFCGNGSFLAGPNNVLVPLNLVMSSGNSPAFFIPSTPGVTAPLTAHHVALDADAIGGVQSRATGSPHDHGDYPILKNQRSVIAESLLARLTSQLNLTADYPRADGNHRKQDPIQVATVKMVGADCQQYEGSFTMSPFQQVEQRCWANLPSSSTEGFQSPASSGAIGGFGSLLNLEANPSRATSGTLGDSLYPTSDTDSMFSVASHGSAFQSASAYAQGNGTPTILSRTASTQTQHSSRRSSIDVNSPSVHEFPLGQAVHEPAATSVRRTMTSFWYGQDSAIDDDLLLGIADMGFQGPKFPPTATNPGGEQARLPQLPQEFWSFGNI